MQETVPITIIDGRLNGNSLAGDSKVFELELNIFTKRLEFKIAAAGNARLADIVPVAREICDKITDATTEYIRSQGINIPCRKNCMTCCNYLVSISASEALYFKQEIFDKPKILHNSMMRKYLNSANRIIKHRPPKHSLVSSSGLLAGPSKIKPLADWYASLKISCPFLSNGRCAIYRLRPFVCREHFVIGSVADCRKNSFEMRAVNMPVQMGNILCRLSRELCGVDEAVILPLALAWCDVNDKLSKQSWPAAVLVDSFIDIVKKSVSIPAYDNIAAVNKKEG